MTGFGLGEAPLLGGRLLLEVRSLNHRFLEVRVRMTSELTEQTFFLEQRCRQLLQRGRFDVAVRLEGLEIQPYGIDLERARRVYEDLDRLRQAVFHNAPEATISLTSVANAPGVIQTGVNLDPERAREALAMALDDALRSLQQMRQNEGEHLQRELTARVRSARQLCSKVKLRSPQLVDDYRRRLTERIAKLLSHAPTSSSHVDATRLELEIALLAEKTDVTEELARLDCHFTQFADLCSDPQPVGRRLDFLLQELGREANTIGSKCPDAETSYLVVELKAELERLREQVQNVE
jgi:uncharacterized protein (TIGR00255 family)